MAVAFQSIGTRTDASTGTSTSAAIQAGVVAGDFLFAVINKSRIGTISGTSTSGWTSIIQSNLTGWEPGILNGNGGKPKWMRWRTFERLAAEHDQFVGRSIEAAALKFGLLVSDFRY